MEETSIWEKTLKASLKLPIVNVNRKEFLAKELSNKCTPDELSQILSGEKSPSLFIPKKEIDKISLGVVNYHLTLVSATSALAGIPGGWAMTGTIPADMAQFFGHVICVAQKLLYLYGYADINDGRGKINDEAANVLTIFIGIMFGCQIAISRIKELIRMASVGIPTVIGKTAVTKTLLFQISKQVAKFLGYKLSRDTFLKGIGKVIPIIGATISGTITYFTFKSMAHKLRNYLRENSFC